MQVISGGTVLALAQSPGFSDFYGQHALQQEILSFLRAWSGPAHLGTHLGQFVRSITKEESKVTPRDSPQLQGSVTRLTSLLCVTITLLCACVQGRLGEFLNARPHLFKVHNHFVSLVEPSTDRELQQGHTTPKPQVRDCSVLAAVYSFILGLRQYKGLLKHPENLPLGSPCP